MFDKINFNKVEMEVINMGLVTASGMYKKIPKKEKKLTDVNITKFLVSLYLGAKQTMSFADNENLLFLFCFALSYYFTFKAKIKTKASERQIITRLALDINMNDMEDILNQYKSVHSNTIVSIAKEYEEKNGLMF